MKVPAISASGRERLGGLLGIAVSVVAVAAVVWWMLRQPAPAFPSSPGALALLVAAIGVSACVYILRGLRWHEVLRATEIDHARADAYALVPVGYMGNTVLPARGGELLRVLILGARSGASRREILGSIVAERLLDLVVLGALFVTLTWLHVAGAPVGQLPAFILAGGALALVVAVAVCVRLRAAGRLERLARLARPFILATHRLVSVRGLALVGVSLVVWFGETAVFFLVGEAVGLEIGLVGALLIVVLASVLALVPAAPGYAGTFDAGVLVALAALDVPGGEAVAFALLVRLVAFGPVTVAGLVILVARYGGLRRWRVRASVEARDQEPVPAPASPAGAAHAATAPGGPAPAGPAHAAAAPAGTASAAVTGDASPARLPLG